VTTSAASTSSGGASPSAMRGGIVIGALKGMNEVMWASVPLGSSSTAKETKNEIRISMVSGVIEAWSSSWRGTSAPAHANSPE
jgi:hypothetical protein